MPEPIGIGVIGAGGISHSHLLGVRSRMNRELARVVNEVSDVKFQDGDLSEAWREGDMEYATVGMRFSMVDVTKERATGRIVEGSTSPVQITEVWTFRRDRGDDGWKLSAIQQA